MSADTKIQWCHHTFNPWRGCAKVSPGCTNCYAETLSHRNPKVLGVWGRDGTRPVGSEAYWRQPVTWNRAAAKAGERRRVFCASLADVFENREDLIEPRARLFALIAATPHLDWLLLTKRPANIAPVMAELAESGYDGAIEGAAFANGAVLTNVWWGATVEDQARADERVPELLKVAAAVRFLSVEPMLGPVDLTGSGSPWWLGGHRDGVDGRGRLLSPTEPRIHWVIVGGESGGGARRCEVAWVRSVVRQCREAGTACFVKQLGARATDDEPDRDDAASWWPHHTAFDTSGDLVVASLRDKKGDPAEWPDAVRVREFPA